MFIIFQNEYSITLDRVALLISFNFGTQLLVDILAIKLDDKIGYLLAALSSSPIIAPAGCGLCGLSVGIMWPGTLSLSAAGIKGGSTAMLAILALAGDLGCAEGPAVVGAVAGATGGNMKTGIFTAAIFPIIMIAGLLAFRSLSKRQAQVQA